MHQEDRQEPAIPKLSELEWEVMKPFWEVGPMAARDVYACLRTRHRWAYKTVKTMLGRLVKKGALTYEQVGNSYLYRAAYSRAEMTRAATGTFVQRVFDGALRPFVAFFAESATPDELQRIREELARLARERSRSREGKDGSVG